MSYALVNKGILGTKLGMTQVFDDSGDVVPCTIIEAGPCTVTQVKVAGERETYEAVQIGFGRRREKVTSKPMRGHYKKAGVEPFRYLREIRLAPGKAGETKIGDEIRCDIFAPGEYVDVIGTMKGRGFAGVVKRHGFATQKESHGGHFYTRHSGSIGCRKPQHTRMGTRMAGQMGNVRRTIQSLRIVRVEKDRNLLFVSGGIPGPNGRLVMVRGTVKHRPAPAPAAAAAE